MEAANLPTFWHFENAKASDIFVIFAKKSWVATKLGGELKQNWGAVSPHRPGPKTATGGFSETVRDSTTVTINH